MQLQIVFGVSCANKRQCGCILKCFNSVAQTSLLSIYNIYKVTFGQKCDSWMFLLREAVLYNTKILHLGKSTK